MHDAITEFIENIEKTRGGRIRVGFFGIGSTTLPIIDTVSKNLPHIPLLVRQSAPIKPQIIASLTKETKLITGESSTSDIDEDILFTSPSVRRENLELSRDTIIISDMDIFFNRVHKNCFAVTGSDGKSTVTTLIELLLNEKFPDIFSGGNLGTPLACADLKKHTAYAIELSSFNLRYLTPPTDRAVITNITPNHLNWHSSYEEYIASKLAIFTNAREAIINVDTPECAKAADGRDLFAVSSSLLGHREIFKKYCTEHAITLEDGAICTDGAPVISIDSLKRREQHNIVNFMSAIAATVGYLENEDIKRVAKSFNGLPHRCEDVGTYRGIRFINSSIDTSPERTRATLMSLGQRVSLILGGRGKGLELTPLKDPLIKYAERIAIYGDMQDEIFAFLSSDRELNKIPHASFDSFDMAFSYLLGNMKRGDTLLLSPAATAYGEFSNFAERGIRFLQLIHENT